MSKDKVKKIVKKYAQKLKEKKYPFSAIYLFGSCAQNKATKNSDIDVAVISDKLKRNWNENEDKLWEYTMEVDSRIEPIGFTSDDFKKKYDPLVAEIERTGVRVI